MRPLAVAVLAAFVLLLLAGGPLRRWCAPAGQGLALSWAVLALALAVVVLAS